VQREHQPNAIHCKMMENERWAKYFATYNSRTDKDCASRTDKDCAVSFTTTLWLFMPMWNDFSLMQPETKEKESLLVEPVSSWLKLSWSGENRGIELS